MRRRLRPIHQHRNAVRVRSRDHRFDGNDGAQRVGHVRDTDELSTCAEKPLIHVEINFTAIVNGSDPYHRAFLFGQHLPRHDVGMMLECGQDDFVAASYELTAKSMSDQIDCIRGAAGEYDLTLFTRIDESLDFAPRRFVLGRRLF